jgi:chromosomal replication initiation ATPase DnaA
MFMGTALMKRGPLYYLYSQELKDKKLREIKEKQEEIRIKLIRDQFSKMVAASKETLPATAIREGIVVASLQTVLKSTAKHFDVSVEDLTSVSRKAKFTYARHVYCYVAYLITQSSSVQISQTIRRDHSTVFNSLYRIRELIDQHNDMTKTDISEVMRLSAQASCIEPFYWGC